jgi:predicted nucleic acid-binding protein
MEVMAGAPTEAESATRVFLSEFTLIAPDTAVAEAAVRIRRDKRIRLSDAIIAATAEVQGALLVTRNTRDFDERDPGIRVPYGR